MINKREALAKYAHDAWSGWMHYMFSKGYILTSNGSLTLPKEHVERWQRQMITPYSDLPESEKASDREQADAIMEIIAEIEKEQRKS